MGAYIDAHMHITIRRSVSPFMHASRDQQTRLPRIAAALSRPAQSRSAKRPTLFATYRKWSRAGHSQGWHAQRTCLSSWRTHFVRCSTCTMQSSLTSLHSLICCDPKLELKCCAPISWHGVSVCDAVGRGARRCRLSGSGTA